MKTHKSNKINLKKLTIARISLNAMNAVKGGSSIPTEVAPTVPPGRNDGICYHRP